MGNFNVCCEYYDSNDQTPTRVETGTQTTSPKSQIPIEDSAHEVKSAEEDLIQPKLNIEELIQAEIKPLIKDQEAKHTHHDEDNIINEFKEHNLDEIHWMNIANCVQHEMYPKLANIIRATINDTQIDIGLYDLEKKHIDEMIDILKTKRNLAVEERMYLEKLCYRAVKFTAITDDNHADFVNYEDVKNDDHPFDNYQTLLQDIFDVHRHFIFSNYHFEHYSLHQFREDMSTATSKYSDQNIIQQFVKDNKIK
eukprot:19501_1